MSRPVGTSSTTRWTPGVPDGRAEVNDSEDLYWARTAQLVATLEAWMGRITEYDEFPEP